MELGSNPLVRRTRLGSELKGLREERNLQSKELVARLGWSTGRLSRLENGKIKPDIGLVMDLLDALGVSGVKRESLIELAREGSRTGWYSAMTDSAGSQRAYAELEDVAASISYYNAVALPGLFQTQDYALVRAQAWTEVETTEVQSIVDARMARQNQVLGQSDVDAVIDEAALRRALAPPEVMAGQLRHLLTITEMPRVTLRILPFDRHTPTYLTCVNPFAIFRYADPADPTVVAAEVRGALLQLRDPDDAIAYETTYDRFAEAALSPDQSREFLVALAEHQL